MVEKESLAWACYTAGWWTNQVVDASGCKTEQYEKLRRVNAEVRRIATTYMRFRNVATHFAGFDGVPDTLGASGPFCSIKAMDGKPLLVGVPIGIMSGSWHFAGRSWGLLPSEIADSTGA